MTPEQFVAKWKDSALGERQAAQSHWNDLCRLLKRPTPAELDREGDTYCFEKGVRKTGGGQGWADVWFKHHFAVEYKGPEKDLVKAYQQLQRYHDWLEHPPLLIVTDTQRFQVHTKFTRTAPRVFRFTIDDFLTGEPVAVDTGEKQAPSFSALQVLQLAFDDPNRLRPTLTTERVTQDASANFAVIAQSMRDRGIDAHQAAHFLMKVLFCLFAEDVGLLPKRLFERILRAERDEPPELRRSMDELFAAMRTGRRFGADRIKHFNGALFDEQPAIEMTAAEIKALEIAAKLDWAHIEPSIFGTLFERSLDPAQRSQLGAHYTGHDDIMDVVRPVVLKPLQREWEKTRDTVAPLLAELEALREKLAGLPPARGRAKQGSERAKVEKRYEKLRAEVDSQYTSLLEHIRHVRILDPACGSGNFLYVALAHLKDLEKRIIQEAYALKLDLAQSNPLVSPTQLYGMEINPYAHELAQVVVWIGYIQWHVRNSYSFPDKPILKPLNNIKHMDALLKRSAGFQPAQAVGVPPTAPASGTDADGAAGTAALRPTWPEADYIIGNPPFLGGNKIRQALGDEYVDTLFQAYDGDVAPFADLSVYWHERARALIAEGKVKRAGLLATQGIRGGANQRTLKRILETGNIFEAWSDREWTLAGAAVHVSIVCQDNGEEKEIRLDGRTVTGITAGLDDVAGADVTMARRLEENAGLCFMGPSPKAPLDVANDVAEEMLRAPLNPNGRPNSDVVKPVYSAVDIARRWRGRYTIDFAMMPIEQASLYEAPFEHIRKHVKPLRESGRRDDYGGEWWRYARPRVELRQALAGKNRFICTPAVAKHRLFVFLPTSVLANQGTLCIAREDDYFFGVLHSVVHERWALRLGTQLEDRPRYTPTTCFETFPFPWPPRSAAVPAAQAGGAPPPAPASETDAGGAGETPALRNAIAQAARQLNELRENWLNAPGLTEQEAKKRTLTNLYNESPTWLTMAHQKLDKAVLEAYGWQDIDPATLSPTPSPGETSQQAADRAKAAEDEMLKRLLALNAERAAS